MTAEMQLRRLIADLDGAARAEIGRAAMDGRFDELARLTPMARDIAAVAARWPCDQSQSDLATVSRERMGSPVAPVASVEIADEPARKATGKLRKADYPQFLREKLDLVKLGWSPREKGPYEHRVPKAGVDAVAFAVSSMGKAGHRFTMDEILKSLESGKGDEHLPSYQTYAVVSWLKWAGMVLQHGRQGYTVVRPQTFASSIDAAWQSLPQR